MSDFFRAQVPADVVAITLRMNTGRELFVQAKSSFVGDLKFSHELAGSEVARRGRFHVQETEQLMALDLKGTMAQAIYRLTAADGLTADDRAAVDALHAALDDDGDPEYWGYQLVEAREKILALLARIETAG